MTLQDLGSIGELVGAVATVATLIYLAIQIRRNTTTLKSQTHYNALELAQRPIESLVESQELAEIVEIGEQDPERLDAAQWKRFCNYQVLAFNGWEYIWLLRKDDAIPDALADAADSYYTTLIHTKPGLRRFWVEHRFVWVDPFLSFVDGVIDDQ